MRPLACAPSSAARRSRRCRICVARPAGKLIREHSSRRGAARTARWGRLDSPGPHRYAAPVPLPMEVSMRCLVALATTLALVSGCGDGSSAKPDAAVDARVDANPVDATPDAMVDAAGPVFSDAGTYGTPAVRGKVFCGLGDVIGQECSLDTTTC